MMKNGTNIKRFIAAALACLLTLCLCACAKPSQDGEQSAPAGTAELKTLSDAIAQNGENVTYGYGDTYFCYVFEKDGQITRVLADLPEDVNQKIEEIDFFDEDIETKLFAVIGSLPIKQIDNLSESIIPQEELDKLAGKTGQQLIDDGFTVSYCRRIGEDEYTQYLFDKGFHSYLITFNEKLAQSDDFEEYEAFKPLTVKSAEYESVSDTAVNPDA